MNRKDFSVEVKIIESEKEKTFDIPIIMNNEIWFQIFMTQDRRAVITASNTTLTG
jgi:hypothetical protein